jgi:cytochrome c-type biogenesis protein CcmF
MPMSEAGISPAFIHDLYASLGEPLENGAWSVRLYHKPMVEWIWFGCLMMGFGGLLALTDKRYRIKKRSKSVNSQLSEVAI